MLDPGYSNDVFCLLYKWTERSDTLIRYPVSANQYLTQIIANLQRETISEQWDVNLTTNSNINVFTYGSLMFERVWSRVVGGVYERLNVTIYGYKRRKLKERAYPAVIPGTRSDSVDGVLYLKIQPADLSRLDRFEGDYYRKEKAECRIPGGKITGAWVYVLKDRYSDLLEDAPWDPAWFAETGIRSFLKNYEGFGLDLEN